MVTLVACIGSLILYARNRRALKRNRIQRVVGRVMVAVFVPILILNFFNNHSYETLVLISVMVVFVTNFIFSYLNYRRLKE